MQLLAVGKVRTSHGLTGEVKFYSYSGEYDHFQAMKSVVLKKGNQEKTVAVEKLRLLDGIALLKFKGIDSPEAAKLLADMEILVDRSLAAPLEPGEVYLSDLVGSRLVYQGKNMATVAGYIEGCAQIMLECLLPDSTKVLVPYHDQFIGTVDLEKKELELKVDWILG